MANPLSNPAGNVAPRWVYQAILVEMTDKTLYGLRATQRHKRNKRDFQWWYITSNLRAIARVSNSYDQPQLPPTKMATAENGETKHSRISGKPDRALCPYDTDMPVSYHTMYFSYDHVF